MKMRTPGVPTIKEYIEKHPDDTIGFDGRVMAYHECQFTNHIKANEDLVDLIWDNRPELSHEEVYLYFSINMFNIFINIKIIFNNDLIF